MRYGKGTKTVQPYSQYDGAATTLATHAFCLPPLRGHDDADADADVDANAHVSVLFLASVGAPARSQQGRRANQVKRQVQGTPQSRRARGAGRRNWASAAA